METIGRTLVIAGIILILVGGGIYLAAKIGFPLSRLPGDIHIERGGFTFYIPLASSILISMVLTVIINVIVRLFNK